MTECIDCGALFETWGQARPSVEAIRRDVLATQRIEGVDALPWLPPLDREQVEADARKLGEIRAAMEAK